MTNLPTDPSKVAAIGAEPRLFSTSTFRMIIGLGRAEHVLGWGHPVQAPVA